MDSYEGLNNPLNHLHVYAWLEVFKHLEDPMDLISVGSTCTLFQNILDNYRINGKVATIEELKLEQAVPFILKWLPMDSICDLRLVCKRMSAGVDKFLEEEERLVPYDNLNLYPRLMTPQMALVQWWPYGNSYEWTNFKLPSQLFKGFRLECLEDLQFLKEARIVGKKMTIDIPKILTMYELEEFRRAVERGDIPEVGPALLRSLHDPDVEFRRQVRIMNIVRFGRRHDPDRIRPAAVVEVNFLKDIVQCFSMSPSHFLRHLNLKTEYLCSYSDIYNWTRELIKSLPSLSTLKMSHLRRLVPQDNPQEEDNRQQFLPLPPCPSLEKIEILADEFAFPEAFCRQVAAQYGTHLRSLSIPLVDDATFMESEDGPLSEEELQAWGGDEPYQFDVLQDFDVKLFKESMTLLSKIQSPRLIILELITTGDDEEAELGIGELIRVILSFPSMKVLSLDGDWAMPMPGDHGAAMEELEKIEGTRRHQNLKVLEIFGRPHPYYIPFQFWYRLCPNLETICF